jgi:hypothetical protein
MQAILSSVIRETYAIIGPSIALLAGIANISCKWGRERKAVWIQQFPQRWTATSALLGFYRTEQTFHSGGYVILTGSGEKAPHVLLEPEGIELASSPHHFREFWSGRLDLAKNDVA